MSSQLILEATSGATSAVIANALVYPLDVVTSRVQTTTSKSTSALLLAILKKRGIRGFYTGMMGTLVQTFFSNFSYFWFYALVKKIQRKLKLEQSTALELFLGALAGALSRTFTTPMSVIATRKQVNDDTKKDSYTTIIGDILKQDGVTGFWRGYSATLVLTINPAITYGLFERLKGLKKTNTARDVFLLGAVTKSLATVVTYPMILAKSRMQGNEASLTLYQCLYNQLLDSGILGLYRGLSMQLIKSVLTQATLFVFKDYLEKMYQVIKLKKVK